MKDSSDISFDTKVISYEINFDAYKKPIAQMHSRHILNPS